MAKQQFLYRIKVNETGKFISPGSRSKATWRRAYAVIDAMKEWCKRTSYHRSMDELTVCVYPVNECTELTPEKFIQDYEDSRQDETDRKNKSIETKKSKLRAMLVLNKLVPLGIELKDYPKYEELRNSDSLSYETNQLFIHHLGRTV